MRFIEKGLPVDYLNRVAMSEGNAKKPVYRMHKWWARRLGSVFRMILLGAFADQDESEAELWRRFSAGYDLGGKVVLDPFMGGGTTIVEALRLGLRVIGIDINPVAWLVTKKEIEPVDPKELEEAFHSLEGTAGEYIKSFYLTTCPAGHRAEVMYFFWVKVATCRKCDARVRLFPNYMLFADENLHISVCPRCLGIVRAPRYDPKTTCPECGEVFDPKEGTSERGLFRCPRCGERERLLDAVKRKGGHLELEPHALEGYCETCGRFFKRMDGDDYRLWEKARQEFYRRKDELLFPRQLIPIEHRSDPRPVNHGYTHFWQMFNERQLLCLSKLLEEILRIPDRNIREFMLVAFSDSLDTNNMFCKYEVGWHKISVFFGLHAYHPIERPAENNVWGTFLGRGSFARCFRKVKRAKEYCLAPYERLVTPDGRRITARSSGERIEGRLVDSFDELLEAPRSALLRCQSSEGLGFIPDGSVDAVVTDPPYFDNLQYSELGDFFYVWLRLGLEASYPWFRPELSSRPEEIVQNEKQGKTVDFFSEGLRKVFSECRRVLKDDGLLIFTFHHNKAWAWENMAGILTRAGFYISKSHIVRSEGKSGLHSSAGNIRYDAILVCRKQPAPGGAVGWAEVRDAVLKEVRECTSLVLRSGLEVNPGDVFTMIMAKAIEHYTKNGGSLGTPLDRALDELGRFVYPIIGEAERAWRAEKQGRGVLQLRLL